MVNTVRYHINISGSVQAVGFRYFAYYTAAELSLTGWVRNCYDGSVEIEAQGENTSVDEYIGKLVKGNGYSSVDNLTYEVIDIKENEKAFMVTF